MDYLYLGKIVDTHGIKGEIRILLNDFFIYDINENKFLDKETIVNLLFIKNTMIYLGKEKREFKINSYRHHKIYEMLCFEGINNINEVLDYKGEKVFVRKSILKDDQVILSSIIGYKVDYNGQDYGKIIDYQNNNGNIIFEIDGEKRYFIPVNSNFIKNIDKNKEIVKVQNIEGLII